MVSKVECLSTWRQCACDRCVCDPSPATAAKLRNWQADARYRCAPELHCVLSRLCSRPTTSTVCAMPYDIPGLFGALFRCGWPPWSQLVRTVCKTVQHCMLSCPGLFTQHCAHTVGSSTRVYQDFGSCVAVIVSVDKMCAYTVYTVCHLAHLQKHTRAAWTYK